MTGFYIGLFSLKNCSLSVLVNLSFTCSIIGFSTNNHYRYRCVQICFYYSRSQLSPCMSHSEQGLNIAAQLKSPFGESSYSLVYSLL